MEPRTRTDPGNHLLSYLLCSTDGEIEAKRWVVLHRPHRQKMAEAVFCSATSLSLPLGLGYTRAQPRQETDVGLCLLNSDFTTLKEPQFVYSSPQLLEARTVRIHMVQMRKLSPREVT